MISTKTIEEIKEKVDIIELVESYGVSLRRTGSSYVGLCPVHDESTPSFNVNPQSGTFKCFGCGIGGDVISFIIEKDSQTFSGAVELLGDMVGVEVIDTAGDDPDYARKKRYLQCVSSASWFYRAQFAHLDESHPAKQDLIKRNYLTVEGRPDWLQEFGVGYAPVGYTVLSDFLMKQGYSKEEIVDAGLAYQNENTGRLTDRFRNRVLWEIRNIKGQVVGFSGRRLNEEDNPKYLNTPETIMYKKSSILFGLDLARKRMVETRTCFVGEGAADAAAISATGYTNAVASCGTSFGSEHASIIRRIIDDFNNGQKGKFVFVFDGDKAGIKAAKRMFTDINPSIKDRSYVALLEDMDPVDFRVAYGDEELRKRLDSPITLTEFMIREIAKKYDLNLIEHRTHFNNEAMQLISYIEQPEIHEEYKRKISFMSGTNIANLRGGHASSNKAYASPIADGKPADEGESKKEEYITPIDSVASNLIACMLQYPNETFFALMNKATITNSFTNPKLVLTLREAMQKTGHTALKNEETILLPRDFTHQDFVLDFYHTHLGTSQSRANEYATLLIKRIEELQRKNSSSDVKTKMIMESLSAEDALKELIAKRKNR